MYMYAYICTYSQKISISSSLKHSEEVLTTAGETESLCGSGVKCPSSALTQTRGQAPSPFFVSLWALMWSLIQVRELRVQHAHGNRSQSGEQS